MIFKIITIALLGFLIVCAGLGIGDIRIKEKNGKMVLEPNIMIYITIIILSLISLWWVCGR